MFRWAIQCSAIVTLQLTQTGIAMMYNYLSDLSLPELPLHLLDGSDKYLHAALSKSLVKPRDASKAGFLCTSIGPATLILLRALQPSPQSRSGLQSGSQSQNDLVDAVPSSFEILYSSLQLAVAPQHTAPDDGCEVLYGRAGLLYAFLRLRSALDQKSPDLAADPSLFTGLQALVANQALSQLVDVIIQRGKNGSAVYAAELASSHTSVSAPPLMWSWRGKRYLGGAHGVGMFSPPCEPGSSRQKSFCSWYTPNCSFVSGRLHHEAYTGHHRYCGMAHRMPTRPRELAKCCSDVFRCAEQRIVAVCIIYH